MNAIRLQKECHVIEHPERKYQPFSLWVKGQVVLFARTWQEIINYAKANNLSITRRVEATLPEIN